MSTSMSFIDHAKPSIEGDFSITVRNRSGDIVYTHRDSNLVVTRSKHILSYLLAGDTTKFITKIALGNNSSTPVPDNTSISGIVTTSLSMGNRISGTNIIAYVKPLEANFFPAFGEVTFHWTLDYEEANGLELCEFGLLSADHNLFARKTRGIITKQSDLAMEGSWRIIF